MCNTGARAGWLRRSKRGSRVDRVGPHVARAAALHDTTMAVSAATAGTAIGNADAIADMHDDAQLLAGALAGRQESVCDRQRARGITAGSALHNALP